jgi:hypothetical protein
MIIIPIIKKIVDINNNIIGLYEKIFRIYPIEYIITHVESSLSTVIISLFIYIKKYIINIL